MIKWRKVLLTDVSIKIGDGLHGTPEYDENGMYFFINGNNLLKGKVVIKPETKKINENEFNKIKKNLNNTTILLSINGTIGNVSKYMEEKCALGKSVCYINLDTNIIIRNYFYYECLSNNFQYHIDNIATGTTIPNVPLKGIRTYEFSIPSLPEQEAIASVLSSLDDKIDLLHRQNKTLESMAETLFRQWFVEEAQDDWAIYKLGDLTDISIGRTPPRKESHWFSNNPNDIKWLSIKDMAESGVYRTNTNECLPLITIETFKIPIIPIDTVVLSFKMTVGRVGITSENMVSNEAIAQFKIKRIITTEFLYCFLKSFNYDTLGTTSTIVTSINTALIKSISLRIPNENRAQEFTLKISPLFLKIKKNQQQLCCLEKLRDTLLPKLMSGEVRVQYTKE